MSEHTFYFDATWLCAHWVTTLASMSKELDTSLYGRLVLFSGVFLGRVLVCVCVCVFEFTPPPPPPINYNIQSTPPPEGKHKHCGGVTCSPPGSTLHCCSFVVALLLARPMLVIHKLCCRGIQGIWIIISYRTSGASF